MKRFLRSDSGTSLVEFALLAPVLAVFVIGLIDVGRYTYYGILAANAARAGVQYGAQNLTTADNTTAIKNAATTDAMSLPNWTTGNGLVTVSQLCAASGGTPSTCTSGSIPAAGTIYYVKVTVTGQFTPLINYPGLPSSPTISGSAIMRVANQ